MRRSLLFVLSVVALVTIVRPYKSHPPIYSDGVGYHLWTRALLQGDLSFRQYAGRKEVHGLWLTDRERGVYINQYPPGLALLRLPIMAWLVNLDTDQPLISRAEHVASLIFGGLALVAICWLCLDACRMLGIDQGASDLALIAVVFGTGLFHYATYDSCFSHIYSALGGTLLLWLGIRAVLQGEACVPWFSTMTAAFLLVLIRNTNVLLLAALAVAYLGARRTSGTWNWSALVRDSTAMVVGVGAAVAVQLGYNYYACNGFCLSGYQEPFLWDHPMQLAVLFSFERGLFMYYPVLAVTLLAGLAVPSTRAWTAWFSLVLLAYATLYGFWGAWTLGGSFGYRGMVDILPPAAVLLAAAFTRLTGWRRTAFTLAAWLSVIITLQLLVGYWKWKLGGETNMSGPYWEHVCGRRSLLLPLHALFR